jgi:hypothetical protein
VFAGDAVQFATHQRLIAGDVRKLRPIPARPRLRGRLLKGRPRPRGEAVLDVVRQSRDGLPLGDVSILPEGEGRAIAEQGRGIAGQPVLFLRRLFPSIFSF